MDDDVKGVASDLTGRCYFYLETDLLKKGKCVEVYKGRDEEGEQVVIKKASIKAIKEKGADFWESIGHRADIAQGLKKGKYTVKVLDCCQTENNIYFILEYCDGQLLSLFKDPSQCFNESKALAWTLEIGRGIQELQEKGIIHLDLTLESIFLKKGHAKIKVFSVELEDKSPEEVLRSLQFRAPEMLDSLDEIYYDKPVDVWALGVMFHEMLFGVNPFKGETEEEIKKNIEAGFKVPEYDGKISKETLALLELMLKKEGGDRVSLQQFLQNDLFKTQEVLDEVASPAKLPEKKPKKKEQEPEKVKSEENLS